MYRSILLPTDGSEAAEAGVREGLRLAQALKARVAFLHVLEPWARGFFWAPKPSPTTGSFWKTCAKRAWPPWTGARAWPRRWGCPLRPTSWRAWRRRSS